MVTEHTLLSSHPFHVLGIWRRLIRLGVDLGGVCFLAEIEKAKTFDFFYLVKSTLLILISIIKVNLLLISLV